MSFSDVIDFSDYGALVALLHNSIIAGALLGLIGGLVGVFVMMRDLSFAVHGISELSFAGAAFALLIGFDVIAGSVIGSLAASLIFGALGVKARERSSIIGVLMPFGLGLGVLFLSLYKGRGANKFGLLTGQIVSVDDPGLAWLAVVSVVVLAALAILWRPLLFATVDPEMAAARGVPVRALAPVFMIVLGLTVAMSVKIIGALLVLALLVTPAAAALRVTVSMLWVPVLSVIFAVTSMVGGIMLALGGRLPISPYITTISFAIYLVCRLIGRRRERAGAAGRGKVPAPIPERGVGFADAAAPMTKTSS